MVNRILFWLSDRLLIWVIHVDGRPYLERYRLGRLFGCNFYLHRFVSSDGEAWLHDHPWRWCLCLVLSGGYIQELWRYLCPLHGLVTYRQRVRWFNLLRERTFHRIDSVRPNTWTLIITRRDGSKEWGFIHCRPADPVSTWPSWKLIYEQPFLKAGDEEERAEDFPSYAVTGREYREGAA